MVSMSFYSFFYHIFYRSLNHMGSNLDFFNISTSSSFHSFGLFDYFVNDQYNLII